MLAEELRTGLASILGYSRTLELRARHLTDEERVEFAGRISAQAERLARLTDYLQTIARIEGTPDEQPADASAVVRAVVTELAEIIDAHHVTPQLSLEERLPLRGGAKALHQIVASLVLAALQVTDDGSRLRISTRPAPGRAVVEIVAAAARQDASARLESLARTSPDAADPGTDSSSWSTPAATAWTSLGPGTELGLSLVRHLVEAHGGVLTIDLADQAMTVCVEVPQGQHDTRGPSDAVPGPGAREGPGTPSAVP